MTQSECLDHGGKHIMRYRLVLSALLCLISLDCSRADTPKLVLNSAYTAPITTPDRTGVLDLFYKELFARLGMAFEIQALPAERALINADKGIDDGDVCRIAGMEKTYPNLVRVPEAVMRYEHVIFARDADFRVTGPEDLRPYDVGVIKGWKIVEWNTKTAHSVTLVNEGSQLFQMLNDGRIDLAIMERMAGVMLMNRLHVKNVHVLEPPFLSGDWYLYLNKKHADLVPTIAAEIRRMKQDGTHKKIFDMALQRFSQ